MKNDREELEKKFNKIVKKHKAAVRDYADLKMQRNLFGYKVGGKMKRVDKKIKKIEGKGAKLELKLHPEYGQYEA